jgi:hypothetical protein
VRLKISKRRSYRLAYDPTAIDRHAMSSAQRQAGLFQRE